VRELRLWQEAVALGGDVARLMRQSSRRESRALTDQITHTAVAVATSVADGYGRAAALEQRDCYRRARRALAELETQLAVARHAELVSPPSLAPVVARIGAVSRLLAGYLAFIERQLSAEAAAAADGLASVSGDAAPLVAALPPTLAHG
jgi:four helix bundle protein